MSEVVDRHGNYESETCKASQEYIQEQFINQTRYRRYGGGPKPHLEQTCDKLLFIGSGLDLWIGFKHLNQIHNG